MTLRSTAVGAVMGLSVVGCGGGGPEVLVGASAIHEARLGVVVAPDRIEAYVCGGRETFETHTKWFAVDGPTDDVDHVELRRDGFVLRLDLNADPIAATLASPHDTAEIPFELNDTMSGSAAGLYVASDRGCRTGVIVVDEVDGAPLVQGTWCDKSGHVAQVERKRPESLIDELGMHGRFSVDVIRPDGPGSLWVEPLAR